MAARSRLAGAQSIDLRHGTHSGTVWKEVSDGISLDRSLSGVYTSPTVPAPEAGTVTLTWQERWTGALQWDKDSRNPMLTPGENDAGALSTPCVLPMGDAIALYYGSRPHIRLAYGSWRDISRWTRHPGPVLSAGPDGAFDAGGVNGPEVVRVSGKSWRMYYVGYHPKLSQGGMPVHQLGLAKSDDGGLTWRRLSDQPVIARGPEGTYDGFSASACSVLRVGSEWWMWYGGIAQVPYLASICLAISSDGVKWKKYAGNPVLRYNPYYRSDALVVARPQVLLDNGVFRMWYSARGLAEDGKVSDYRVCYAESLDGIHWDRFPGNPVLRPSVSGWDGKMVEYPEVIKNEDGYHMWFCGDGYGSLGYARGHSVTKVQVQTRSGPTSTPDGGWRDWSSERIITGCFLQVRVKLETKDPAISPVVQGLRLQAQ